MTTPLEKLRVNGPLLTVSDTTDIFTLVSVIFEVESGAKPDLAQVYNSLGFPAVAMGNESLDSIILGAWRASYLMTVSIRSTTFRLLLNDRTSKPRCSARS